MKSTTIIIYGSYGYTGKLVAKECKAKNLSVILAGRNREALQKQHEQTGYPFEVVDVSDSEALKNLLQKGAVVIHCGGPFRFTAKAMADACLETKTHYTDITGEHQVFEMLAGYNEKAQQAGIMIMPGTGFDVVPSDCLALHLKNQLPTATHLQLAFAMSKGGMSRGTKKSMTEGLGYGSMIREEGLLKSIPLGKRVLDVDFGSFKSKALNIPWGDISTAYRSTGIPNIEVYSGATDAMISNAKRSDYLNWLLRMRWVKDFMLKKIDKGPAGPTDEKRETGRSYLWGKVKNATGETRESLLEAPSGYALTAMTAVLIAEKILDGNLKIGYQTPAKMYGENLILEVPTAKRFDV